MKNILITGITGFVGSHLCDYILNNHKDVKVFGTKRYHLSRLEHVKHIYSKINWYDCDITDLRAVLELIDNTNPDIIFHCAAESFVSPSWRHPRRYMDVNYLGTVNLLDALQKLGKKNTIFHIPGSGEEYGLVYESELPINDKSILRPVNPYAVTKVAQDLIGYVYHKSYDLNVVRTRAFNHEGPRREKVFGIPWYAYQIARIEKKMQAPIIKTGHIKDKRNFTHVKDMVEAYWLAAKYCDPGELYLIGNNKADSIHTFEQAIFKLIEISNLNKEEIKIISDKKYIRPTNVPFLIADMEKFIDKTNWSPKINFETILLDTLNYWRERIENEKYTELNNGDE